MEGPNTMGNKDHIPSLAAIPQGGAVVRGTQAGYPTPCVTEV